MLSINSESYGTRESKLKNLFSALDSIGAKYLPFETNESGRIDIYLVFRKDVEVLTVTELLSQWFSLNRLDYIQIIPPSEPIDFPLQAGFSWLSRDARVIVRKSDIHNSAAIKMLLDGLARAEMDSSIFLEKLTTALSDSEDDVQVVQTMSSLSTVENSPPSPIQTTLRKIAIRNHWYYDYDYHPATRVIPADSSEIQSLTNGERAPPDYRAIILKRLH